MEKRAVSRRVVLVTETAAFQPEIQRRALRYGTVIPWRISNYVAIFFFLRTWDEFNKMPRLKKELRKQYDNPSRVWNLSTEGNVIFTICPSNETNEGRNI